jgi:hypothetical protein
MESTIGRIVEYYLTEDDKTAWENNLVYLKVMVDGPMNDLWRTSVSKKEKDGQDLCWDWPARV